MSHDDVMRIAVREAAVEVVAALGLDPTDEGLDALAEILRERRGRTLKAKHLKALVSLGIDPEAELPMTHEEMVQLAVGRQRAVGNEACARAFVVGLNPDRAMFRAPLRARALLAHFAEHEFQLAEEMATAHCRVCGFDDFISVRWSPFETMHGAFNGLHGFETDLVQAACVLHWFSRCDVPEPTDADRERFGALLGAIDEAPARTGVAKLAQPLGPILGGDKYTRRYVFETLGYCSVLSTEHGRWHLHRWQDWLPRPDHPDSEIQSPASLWKRGDGFDAEVFGELFPDVPLPSGLVAGEGES